MDVLKKDEWTSNVTNELRTFERSLITALKQKGKEIFVDVHIFYTQNKKLVIITTKISDTLILFFGKGWDGSESEDTVTWSFSGGLFYSITVITTIGKIQIQSM